MSNVDKIALFLVLGYSAWHRPHRLTVRTAPFHGVNRGSIPREVTNILPLSSRKRYNRRVKKKGLKTAWVVGGVLVFCVLIGGLCYLLGYFVAQKHYESLFGNFAPIRQVGSTYPLISPLLGFRAPEATELGEYLALKESLESAAKEATSTGAASEVSIYFRDLNMSEWVGVNQNASYYPASLLKVPVLIAYYKEAEVSPGILSQQVVYRPVNSSQFDAPSTLVPGKSYSVEQLLESMIVESDNGATQTLLTRINQATLDQVYVDLGITNPGVNSATYELSARSYGLFFRVLYNATYLEPEYSEKALALLSKATFAQGLVAGVPDNVVVAHKFGEHVLSKGSTPTGVEFHDCGIVYYPKHPYLLCVMTSAADISSAYAIIKKVSALTYSAVDAQYTER